MHQYRWLHYLIALAIGAGLVWFIDRKDTGSHTTGWKLIYAHDETGKALEGSKAALINAVREGKAIRVYFRGRRVEHAADAFFLTIFGDEVFAQIETIQGQAPSLDPPKIEFRENQWRTIHSTNGERALKWFAYE